MRALRRTRASGGAVVFQREANAAYEVITAPSVEPVSVEDVKARLGFDLEDGPFDTMLSDLIVSARQYCEEQTGLALITQTLAVYWDRFPFRHSEWWDGVRQMAASELSRKPGALVLPKYPAQSVTSVKVFDTQDAETTVDASVYQADTVTTPPRLVLREGQTWPSTSLRTANGVRVEYVAGYGATAATVPQPLRGAIGSHAAYMFEHRGACDMTAAAQMSGAVSLWRPYRIARI